MVFSLPGTSWRLSFSTWCQCSEGLGGLAPSSAPVISTVRRGRDLLPLEAQRPQPPGSRHIPKRWSVLFILPLGHRLHTTAHRCSDSHRDLPSYQQGSLTLYRRRGRSSHGLSGIAPRAHLHNSSSHQAHLSVACRTHRQLQQVNNVAKVLDPAYIHIPLFSFD